MLDAQKHYWVGDDEVEKLLARGEGWLPNHPDRELIVEPLPEVPAAARARGARAAARRRRRGRRRRHRASAQAEEEAVEEPMRLQRAAARRRCRGAARERGDARARPRLRQRQAAARAAGGAVVRRRSSASTSPTPSLEIAKRRLRLDRLPPRQRERIELFQTALTYRDQRLAGFDAAAVVEVIEHLDQPRLRSFERVVFEHAQPEHGRRDDAEPRVQREVRGPAGRAVPSPRPPLRVDACRVRGLGRANRGRSSATRVRFLPIGPEDRRAWRADADGGVRGRDDTAARDPGAVARRARRRLRLRQVDVRAHALPADRGRLVRLLPRRSCPTTRTPRTRPTTRSSCCTTSPASGWLAAG